MLDFNFFVLLGLVYIVDLELFDIRREISRMFFKVRVIKRV